MVIETTTFRLADGVEDADFLAADAEVQPRFVYQQPGLIRRTTARGDHGDWLVLTFWATAAQADQAARAAAGDPTVAAFEALIDPSTLRTVRHTAIDG